jgi:hypothetical protein
VSKKTPRCWIHKGSQLPCGEYTGESWLPSDEYARESWLPGDKYAGESPSWCIWTKHENRFTKNFLVTKRPVSKDPPSVLITGESRLPDVFLWINLGQLPGVFVTRESWFPGDKYTGESRLHGGEYTGGLISPVVKTPGSWLRIWIAPRIFEKIWNPFYECRNGTRRNCLMKKARVNKSRDTVPLIRYKFVNVAHAIYK